MDLYPVTDQPNQHTVTVTWPETHDQIDFERILEQFPSAELVNGTLYIEGTYIPYGSRIHRVAGGTKWWVE